MPALDRWNENSTVIVNAAFVDEDGAPVTPNAAKYRVDDHASETAIVALTAISPLSTAVDIEIPGSANKMVDTTKRTEVRKVTVQFTYGSGRRGTAEYRYELVNLQFVTATLVP